MHRSWPCWSLAADRVHVLHELAAAAPAALARAGASAPATYPACCDSLPVLMLSGAFLGILLTSFGVLLQALYLAGDMDFLLSTPVPIRAVFMAKLLQAIVPNLALICLFALPVLFGLGLRPATTSLYYPLVLLVLAALALAAAGLRSAAGDGHGAHLPSPAGGRGAGLCGRDLIIYLLAIRANRPLE